MCCNLTAEADIEVLAYMPLPSAIIITMAARQQRLGALRNNQDLARFVIEGEANGRQLGIGSYGSVEEVSIEHLASYEYALKDVVICTYHCR